MLPNKLISNSPNNTLKWSDNTATSDRLVPQQKNAPASAQTPVIPGLIATKERLITNRIKIPLTTPPQTNARLFLEMAADDLVRAKRARDYYITLASKYGLSNVAIGRAVGLSETRVRQVLGQSHGELAHTDGGDNS